MDAVYPAATSALARGRRRRRAEPRHRHHTMPVTFAEIKEVDEDKDIEEKCSSTSITNVSIEERRRRPDVLDECLTQQFAEFRNRRNRRRREVIHEPDEIQSEESRAQSEPCPGTATSTAPT